MRGLRRELLPEIAGPAVYRVAPSLDLSALPASGAVMAAIQRLARQSASLRELADWPGMDRERATRLLNALYLQSGLIVSRSHPDAVRDGWFCEPLRCQRAAAPPSAPAPPATPRRSAHGGLRPRPCAAGPSA